MKRLACAALAVALTLFATEPASAQKKATAANSSGDILPFKATEKTLANGLKIIVVPTGFPNIVSFGYRCKPGRETRSSRASRASRTFFEHIMFRGTKTMTKEQANTLITKAGARENASTSDDFTNYYITFAKEDLESMIRLQADRFQNLSYSEEDFKTESRAVLGEYNKNSAAPGAKLYEVLRDNAFTTHTYKHTTMGFIRDIENMPTQFEYSKTFFDRWYRPEFTTIIVAGDVTPAEVIPLVEKYWGNWKRGTFSVNIPKEPPPTGPKYAHVPWTSPTLPYLAVAFRNPAFSETVNDNAALDMVSTLYFGPTSEIYKKLVQREQKVDGLSAGNSSNADPELFTIFARVKKADDIAYVRDEILKTDRESQSDARIGQGPCRGEGKFPLLVRAVARQHRPNRSRSRVVCPLQPLLQHPQSRLRALRRADTRRSSACSAHVLHRQRSRGRNACERSAAVGDRTAAEDRILRDRGCRDNQWRENGATTANAAPTISTKLMSGNGASGTAVAASNLVIQRNPLPQLRYKLVFNTGSAKDPAGKEGLAVLASSMIARAGSKDMTFEQINKALYPMAGSFGNQVDKELPRSQAPFIVTTGASSSTSRFRCCSIRRSAKLISSA
jgi:zinc protease